MSAELVPENIRALERPGRALWRYYVVQSICSGPLIFFTFPYLYFRYHTLRYRFDEEGIHMKVGLLFRREVNLTYARIQDIHLKSGLLQRWLGLANVEVQTASGSATAEVVVEGFKEFEAIRDFLYTRMRGYQAQHRSTIDAPPSANMPSSSSGGPLPSENPETVSLLLSIRDELRRTRE